MELDVLMAGLQDLIEDYYAGVGDKEIATAALRLQTLIFNREQDKTLSV